MVRKHIIVSGRVQGVGFRYICTGIASKYNCTGWVRNLYDGTVEIEVQGLRHRVDCFILDVKEGNRFAIVRNMEIKEIPLVNVGQEKSFSVKFDR